MDTILPAFFQEFHSIENSGNVGNTSILFSDYMGLSPIILVGQDFGYTGGKMHAHRFQWIDGKPQPIEEDHAALLEKRSGKVEINDVVTYMAFHQYMATTYALRSKRHIDVINCTEGGILRDLPCSTLDGMIERLKISHGDKYISARAKLAAAK